MLQKLGLAVAFALAGVIPAHAAMEAYELDPHHTQIVFSWSHFGFSNPSGQFGSVQGTLQFDPEAPESSSLKVTVALPSINTNVPDLDEHLQKADFFDVATYPVATFTSTKVEAGAEKDRLKVTGDLDLHGVVRPLVLDVTVNRVGKHPMSKVQAAGFNATGVLKRSEFGIKQYAPLISDDIRLQITVEALAKANASENG